MNAAHFHLLLNHLPIIIPFIGFMVFFIARILKQEQVVTAGLIILIIGGLSAFPANFSGEQAEEFVENINGFSEQAIEHHEDQAKVLLIVNLLTALVSASYLFLRKKFPIVQNLATISLALFMFVYFYGAYTTGESGGQLRHPEISNSNQAPSNVANDSESDED